MKRAADQTSPADRVPVLDFDVFLRTGQVPPGFSRALRDHGNLYLRGEAIPVALLQDCLRQARAFFALPTEQKMECFIGPEKRLRGYWPVPAGPGDYKEWFFCTNALGAEAGPGSPLAGESIWPSAPLGFRQTMQQALEALSDLSRLILRAIAVELGLAPGFFEPSFGAQATAGLRLLRYPPSPTSARNGAAPHTDLPTFALLAMDEVPALEARAPDGDWMSLPAIPGTLVLQAGSLLERWTNGVCRASLHRVVNRTARERHSLAFFFMPQLEAEIACIETCRGSDAAPRHPPVSFQTYLEQWVTETAREY